MCLGLDAFSPLLLPSSFLGCGVSDMLAVGGSSISARRQTLGRISPELRECTRPRGLWFQSPPTATITCPRSTSVGKEMFLLTLKQLHCAEQGPWSRGCEWRKNV